LESLDYIKDNNNIKKVHIVKLTDKDRADWDSLKTQHSQTAFERDGWLKESHSIGTKIATQDKLINDNNSRIGSITGGAGASKVNDMINAQQQAQQRFNTLSAQGAAIQSQIDRVQEQRNRAAAVNYKLESQENNNTNQLNGIAGQKYTNISYSATAKYNSAVTKQEKLDNLVKTMSSSNMPQTRKDAEMKSYVDTYYGGSKTKIAELQKGFKNEQAAVQNEVVKQRAIANGANTLVNRHLGTKTKSPIDVNGNVSASSTQNQTGRTSSSNPSGLGSRVKRTATDKIIEASYVAGQTLRPIVRPVDAVVRGVRRVRERRAGQNTQQQTSASSSRTPQRRSEGAVRRTARRAGATFMRGARLEDIREPDQTQQVSSQQRQTQTSQQQPSSSQQQASSTQVITSQQPANSTQASSRSQPRQTQTSQSRNAQQTRTQPNEREQQKATREQQKEAYSPYRNYTGGVESIHLANERRAVLADRFGAKNAVDAETKKAKNPQTKRPTSYRKKKPTYSKNASKRSGSGGGSGRKIKGL